jgi:hypothetical protein
MPRLVCKLCLLLVAFTAYSHAASLSDLRTAKLPNDPAIQPLLSDVRDLEPWVRSFAAPWHAPMTKEAATARIAADLQITENLRQKYPDNAELALLSGLVASYAFNLDVNDSWNIAPAALSAATKLDSSDLRGKWFLAAHNCQTSKLLKEGMSAMLDVQASSRNDLPSSFWFDYMTCATVADMPAHAAAASLHLGPADLADPIANAVINKMRGPASLTQDYKPEALWSSAPVTGGTLYRNYACGISFVAPSNWQPRFHTISTGRCIVLFELPAVNGVKGSWLPNILVVVHAPLAGESFEDSAKRFEGDRGVNQENAQLAALCPVKPCRTADKFDKETYPSEGGGHGIILQFERTQPQVTGIALETFPMPPPTDRDITYRPNDYIARFPGNLYYTFLLDSAVSILPQASQSFTDFLKTVHVD